MINEDHSDDVAPESSDAGKVTTLNENDTVSFRSYDKAIKKTKNAVERAQQAEDKLAVLEQAKMESEGKIQELYDREKVRASEFEQKFNIANKKFALKTVDQTVARELASRGCKNVDDALILLKNKGYDELSVSEDYEVDDDSMKRVLDTFQKNKVDYFTRQEIKVNDRSPKPDSFKPKSKDTSKMSANELAEFIKNKYS